MYNGDKMHWHSLPLCAYQPSPELIETYRTLVRQKFAEYLIFADQLLKFVPNQDAPLSCHSLGNTGERPQEVTDQFRPSIAALAQLLNRDLTSWLSGTPMHSPSPVRYR